MSEAHARQEDFPREGRWPSKYTTVPFRVKQLPFRNVGHLDQHVMMENEDIHISYQLSHVPLFGRSQALNSKYRLAASWRDSG